MKLSVTEIGGAVLRDDGVISLGVKNDKGEVHTVEFHRETYDTLLTALLSSAVDPFGPVSRRFRPQGLGRFQVDNDVGITFFLRRDIAIHVLLNRELASHLEKRILATFNDPTTWNTTFDTSKKPN